jgi:hypothetical protein
VNVELLLCADALKLESLLKAGTALLPGARDYFAILAASALQPQTNRALSSTGPNALRRRTAGQSVLIRLLAASHPDQSWSCARCGSISMWHASISLIGPPTYSRTTSSTGKGIS